MNTMHPFFKGLAIGYAIMLPITLVVGLTDPGRGVVALVTTAGMFLSVLIFTKLYIDWKEQQ